MSRSVHVRLPPISDEEACILVRVLELLLEALWAAHGDAIADWTATHGDIAPLDAAQDDPFDPTDTADIPF